MLFSLLHLSAFWGNFENFRPLPLRSLASHHCVLVFCLVESSSGRSPWGLDLLNCSTSFWTMLKKTALFLHGGFPNWGYSCKTGHFSSIVLITFTYLTMLILWLWLNAVAGWQKLCGSTGTSHFFRIAKDCLLTGQEQACTRITRLFVRLVVTMPKMAEYTEK